MFNVEMFYFTKYQNKRDIDCLYISDMTFFLFMDKCYRMNQFISIHVMSHELAC